MCAGKGTGAGAIAGEGLTPTQEPERERRERHREPPQESQAGSLPTVPSVIIKGEREGDLCTAPSVVLIKEEEKEARIDMIQGVEETRMANHEIFGVPKERQSRSTWRRYGL